MRDINRANQIGWSQESAERRGRNRVQSAQFLDSEGIEYESKNDGAHLVITLPDRKIDFWPGTGKWTDRRTKHTARGVVPLIRRIKRLKFAQGAKTATPDTLNPT